MKLNLQRAQADERAAREAKEASDAVAETRAQQEKDAIAKQREALDLAITPADQRKQRGMRQISVWLTEQEHETLHANARARKMTMKALVMACLRPVTESIPE